MGFIRWIIGFLIAVSIVFFAISNRHNVDFYLTPFHPPFELPFYMIGLALMGAGFLLGSFIVWLNAAPIRRSRLWQKKQIKKLEKELSTVNENGKADSPPSDFFPALPAKRKSSK